MAYTGYERYANENKRTQQKADNNMRRVNNNIDRERAEYRAADRANRAKMEGFINSMPEGFEAEQLSEKYKPGLEKFLKAGKDKYANAAMEIQDYEPGTEEYQFYKDQMNQVNSSFKSAKSQVDMFGTNKKDLGIDLSNGTYSKGNDVGEMGLLTSVYTDEMDMVFNENGTIGFDDGNGNVTNFNELPDYFNKDFKTGDAIQKMAEGIYKSGQPFNPATKLMHRNKLQSMIEQGGIETLYSLASDDFFNQGGLGIDISILKDPNRRDEVEEMVIDQFLGVLESQARSGSVYNQKSQKKKTKPGDEADKEYFSPETLSYIDETLPTLPMDTPENVIDSWNSTGVFGTKFKMLPDGAGGYVVQAIHGRRRDFNVGVLPKTDHQGFMNYLKRNGIKP